MPREHVIRPGECATFVAFENGFFAETIWNDPANAGLRELRGNMNILEPGDLLVIPDKRTKELPGQTGKRNRFKLKGVPAKFRLRLMHEDQPRVGVEYELDIDGTVTRGKSDANGMIERWIPPNAKQGWLRLDGEGEFPFRLGHLSPIENESGIRERLQNLGFLDSKGDRGALLAAAAAFRRKHELAPPADETDPLDEPFRSKLVEVHGS